MTIPIAKPRMKPDITAFDRKVEIQPIRSEPERDVDEGGGERERRRVGRGLVRPERGRADERCDHGRRDRSDRRARADDEVLRGAEQRIHEQRRERRVEAVLHGDADDRRVRQALRDEERPDGQPRYGIGHQPSALVCGQPTDDREVSSARGAVRHGRRRSSRRPRPRGAGAVGKQRSMQRFVPPEAHHVDLFAHAGGHRALLQPFAGRRTVLEVALRRGVCACRQTERLTGEVAIQRAVPRNTAHPMQSIAMRSLGDVSLVLIPAKNRADANRTTPST